MKNQTPIQNLEILKKLIDAKTSGKYVIIKHETQGGIKLQNSFAKVNQIDLGNKKVSFTESKTVFIDNIQDVVATSRMKKK